MQASISAVMSKVVASAFDGDSRTMLTFKEVTNEPDIELGEFTLFLPKRMSACASMIVEAFNAHMRGDAKTLAAQGETSVQTEIEGNHLHPIPVLYSDGVRDDTDALQAILDGKSFATPDGTIHYPPHTLTPVVPVAPVVHPGPIPGNSPAPVATDGERILSDMEMAEIRDKRQPRGFGGLAGFERPTPVKYIDLTAVDDGYEPPYDPPAPTMTPGIRALATTLDDILDGKHPIDAVAKSAIEGDPE